MSFSVCFDDNLSVIHVFIKQIFRAVALAPPPHRAVQGVGEKWLFSSTSRSFGYGYEEGKKPQGKL
jgi:hypothetical protein